MNRYFKILSLSVFTLAIFSCKNDDLKYDAQENMGWIQFVEGQYGGQSEYNTNQAKGEVFRIPVNIQVPRTTEDLIINYDLVSVSGANPSQYFGTSIVVPAGQTTYGAPDNSTGINYLNAPTIDIDVSSISDALTEPMVFDIVLSSTNLEEVQVGLPSENFPLTTRISICPSLYDSSTNNYLGDYNLTIPSGNGPFGPRFDDNQTVTLSEGPNGSMSRQFTTHYLPAFTGTTSPDTIIFDFDQFGNITIYPEGGELGCASEIIFTGTTSAACDDDVIELNMLDFFEGSGGCGVSDDPFTIVLTKI